MTRPPVLAAVLAGLLAVTATTTAAAAPTTTTVGGAAAGVGAAGAVARHVQQRPLVDAATLVRSAAEASRPAGLASIVIEQDSVTVWWKGGRSALPAPVAAAVARAGDLATVRVADAAHSRAELLAASATIEARLDADPAFVGVKAEPDGSRLVVAMDTAPTGAGPGTAGTRAGSAVRVPDVGVPTTVAREARLRPVSRRNDSSPWSGGALNVNSAQRTACTAGFGVTTPTGSAIATAGHCGEPGQRITDGAGEAIGSVGADNDTLDTQLIPTNAVSNLIYVGGRDSSTTRRVTSGGAPFVGEVLCQSGNTSAEAAGVGAPVCNLKVLFEWTDSQRLWEAEQQNGQTAARPGDSGGPVYVDRGDGTVLARGTTTRVAGNRLGFAGFEKFQREWNVAVPGGSTTPPPSTAGVSFYTNCQYDALWKTLAPGSYVVQSANDAISSLRVPAGYRVTLFDSSDLTGASITKTADDGCLVDDGWNDRVSSLRIDRL